MSNSYEIIKRKAIEHIWQNPSKDKQVIVELSRLSPKNGYQWSGKVGWDTLVTPTEKGFYHFYQIGDNLPGQFSLIAAKNQWYRLSDWCKVIDLVLHVYNKHGRLIPNDNVFMYRMYNDNIIIAILRNDNIVDLNEDTVYIHFYRNAYFSVRQGDNNVRHIDYTSNKHSEKVSSQLIFEKRKLIQNGNNGVITRLTNNGYLKEGLEVSELKIGDVTELYYDMSIYEYIDLPLDELRTFTSTLDEKSKYLLHPPKSKDLKHVIYRDDVDIFVCKWDVVNNRINKKKSTGLYYHHNMEDAVRMVTHRDYSVPVPYVMSYVNQLDAHPDLHHFFIRIYFRHNGQHRELIDDVNNIKALYQLSDEQIVEAMAKVNSTVPEWQANTLESSAYTALMRSHYNEITPALVLDAMGYNTTIKLLADPNHQIKRSPNGDHFVLPEGLYKSCTIYEYNANGLLLGWYYQADAKRYYPRSPECIFIEALAGKGGDDINMFVGNQPFTLNEDTAYRFYRSSKTGDAVNNDWQDITGTDRILIDGLRCTMQQKPTGELLVAMGDNLFLSYETLLDGNDGILDFRLTYGIKHTSELVIPPGKLDVWLNGHALVEDIDYYVDFPDVIIVNKKYVNQNDYQKITVRGTGFPFMVGTELKRVKPRETGFVQYGKVSVDNHYDLHADKILRTVVNGGVFDPSVIPFDDNGNINVTDYISDGLPYSIETPYVAMVGTLNISLYQQQIKDYDLTARLQDYLTTKLPKKQRPVPPHIPTLYHVYSPFLSKITMDLKYGRLQSPAVNVTPQTLDKIMSKYKKYLPLDPIIRGYDKHFVAVHPHNQLTVLDVSPRDLEFLRKLNKLYLNNAIDLSVFYRVRKGSDK